MPVASPAARFVPHLDELLVGQPFPSAQQPAAGSPGRVDLATPLAVGVPRDAATDVGDGLVRQSDQVEVIGDDQCVRQRLADGGNGGSGMSAARFSDRVSRHGGPGRCTFGAHASENCPERYR